MYCRVLIFTDALKLCVLPTKHLRTSASLWDLSALLQQSRAADRQGNAPGILFFFFCHRVYCEGKTTEVHVLFGLGFFFFLVAWLHFFSLFVCFGVILGIFGFLRFLVLVCWLVWRVFFFLSFFGGFFHCFSFFFFLISIPTKEDLKKPQTKPNKTKPENTLNPLSITNFIYIYIYVRCNFYSEKEPESHGFSGQCKIVPLSQHTFCHLVTRRNCTDQLQL